MYIFAVDRPSSPLNNNTHFVLNTWKVFINNELTSILKTYERKIYNSTKDTTDRWRKGLYSFMHLYFVHTMNKKRSTFIDHQASRTTINHKIGHTRYI